MKNYKYKTTEEFIKSSVQTHGDKYDYTKSLYINAKTKVKIICPIHGEFEQTPRYHIKGYNCPKCSGTFMDKKYFIEKANIIHNNKYNYSLVNYVNNTTDVKIICPIHGEFEQKPKYHVKGYNCQKCSGKFMNTEYFIQKANTIHGFKYDYKNTKFLNSSTKVKIICPIHGEFEQTANSHLNGRGCSACNESKGEKEIMKFLVKNNLVFKRQYKFDDCKNINYLPFDFYLPKHNTCIEYHGIQHYKPVKIFGGVDSFRKTLIRDNIKFNYCLTNKINLIIINDIKNIEKILLAI